MKPWLLDRNHTFSSSNSILKTNQFCWELQSSLNCDDCFWLMQIEVKQRKHNSDKSRVAWKCEQKKVNGEQRQRGGTEQNLLPAAWCTSGAACSGKSSVAGGIKATGWKRQMAQPCERVVWKSQSLHQLSTSQCLVPAAPWHINHQAQTQIHKHRLLSCRTVTLSRWGRWARALLDATGESSTHTNTHSCHPPGRPVFHTETWNSLQRSGSLFLMMDSHWLRPPADSAHHLSP